MPSKPNKHTTSTTDISGNPPPKYDQPNITYQGEQPKPTPWGQASVYISSPRPGGGQGGGSGSGSGSGPSDFRFGQKEGDSLAWPWF